MYGISIETIHMVNRMDAETKREALHDPKLRKSSVVRLQRKEEKKQIREWIERISESEA